MKINALKGVQDILPQQIKLWDHLHDNAKQLFAKYTYEQIIIPIIEESSLFTRSIGQQTDIVEKEMYCLTDRGGRNIALRPEATASVVRAYLEHDLARSGKNKLFYMGPMFRGEKPQAGRNRQFYQIGIEAFGSYNNFIDAEVISLAVNYLRSIGLSQFEVQINTVGTVADKNEYSKKLRDFLKDKLDELCDNCKTRYQRNVLRILDCKSRNCKKTIESAPNIINSLSEQSTADFETLKEALDLLGVKYSVCNNLVRGLDYYTKTVFEITHGKLGAQNTILAGGRYDNLVEELGGKPTGAVGFACGVERLMIALEAEGIKIKDNDQKKIKSVFLIGLGDSAYKEVFKMAQELRAAGIVSYLDFQGKSLKAQMRLANKSDCAYALILGADELDSGQIQLKDMINSTQEMINIKESVKLLKAKFTLQ